MVKMNTSASWLSLHTIVLLLLCHPKDNFGCLSKSGGVNKPPKLVDVDVTWLNQDIQFSRDNFGVVFNPFELKQVLEKQNSNSEGILNALIKQVSTKFSTLLISTAREPGDEDSHFELNYSEILSLPRTVALFNNGSEVDGNPVELLFEFGETSTIDLPTLAQEVNEIFPGTMKQLIFCPSNSARDLFDLVYDKINSAKLVDLFKDFNFGIRPNTEGCDNLAQLEELLALHKEYFNSLVIDTIYISLNAPPEYSNMDMNKIVPKLITKFDNCKKSLGKYFVEFDRHVEVAFITQWSITGKVEPSGLVRFVQFWEQLNDWASKTKTRIIFSSAFDEPILNGTWGDNTGEKYGWWRLLENENGSYPDSVEKYRFEDKKKAAMRYYPKDKSSKSSTNSNSFNILQIVTVIFLIFLTAALATIGYLLKTRESKSLTKEDIAEFFDGGDNNFLNGNENLNGPYNKMYFELPKKSFKINEKTALGSGEFGKVCAGTVTKIGGEVQEVAVKITKVPSPRTTLRGFLFEIKMLSCLGKHRHVVELVGAYTAELKKSKVFIFLEFCELGSLEKYLRSYNPRRQSMEDSEDSEMVEEDPHGDGGAELEEALVNDMARWSGEIANGMEFIASKHIVHLDIASRNVLLTAEKQAKISDFGLSRRMYDYQTYVKTHQEALPWCWMSPEALRISEFTEKSDVWSFGVLLWEIYSLGDKPYGGLSWKPDFPSKLEKGLRLPEPKYSRNSIYTVMLRCWNTNPDKRPTFSELAGSLYQTPVGTDELANDITANPVSTDISYSSKNAEAISTPLPSEDIEKDSGKAQAHPNTTKSTWLSFGFVWSSLAIILLLIVLFIAIKAGIKVNESKTANLDDKFKAVNGSDNSTHRKNDQDNSAVIDFPTDNPFHEENSQLRSMKAEMERSLGRKLFILIGRQNEEDIPILFNLGADLNVRNDKGETALINVATCENKLFAMSTIKFLIENGANISATDMGDYTFLHRLVDNSNTFSLPQFRDILTYLISKNLSQLFNTREEASPIGYPFQLAVQNIEIDMTTLSLLKNNSVSFNAEDSQGNAALYYAVKGGRSAKLLSDLVNIGAYWSHLNNNNSSLLHIAAAFGNVEHLKFFVSLGLDINAVNFDGNTPLHLALSFYRKNTLKIVEFLLEKGANTSAKNSLGRTPLHPSGNWRYAKLEDAVNSIDEDGVNILVQLGADINQKNERLETPLHRAALSNDKSFALKVIELLIDSGANVHEKDMDDYTFLHRLVDDETNLTPTQFDSLADYLISKNISYLFNSVGNFQKEFMHAGRSYSYRLVTPFQLAVKNLEILPETLSQLRNNHVNLNALNANGDSIFFCAILGQRSMDMFSSLVELGASWKILNKENSSLLHVAAVFGNVDHLTFFSDSGLDVNAVNSDGNTPLHLALSLLSKNSYAMAQYLIFSKGTNFTVKNKTGQTPEGADIVKNYTGLTVAIDRMNEEAIKFLIKIGADVNAKDRMSNTPLHEAALSKNKTFALIAIRLLIEGGADVYVEDNYGYIFLRGLVQEGSNLTSVQFHELTNYLLSKDLAKLFSAQNLYKSGSTPLMMAIENLDVNTSTISVLHKKGVSFNKNTDEDDNSILYYALKGKRSRNLLSELVRLGANPKHRNENQQSLLHVAVRFSNLEGLKFLLDLKSDADAQDEDNKTPLHWALEWDRNELLEIVQVLIESGANVNKWDEDGKTPLMYAEELNYTVTDKDEVIKLLRNSQ